jgi:hypothetical protein
MSQQGGKLEYGFIDSWGKLPLWWKFRSPSDMAIDSQGRIFLLHRGAHPVIVFDGDGNFLTAWGEGLFRVPHGIFIDRNDKVYVADSVTHLVSRFTLDGKLEREWGTRDMPGATFYGEPFNQPTGVAFGPSGCMYVSDGYGNFKVQKFAPDGSFLKSWGKPGTGPGEFSLVHNLDVGPDERVYVCDREGRRVQIFDEEGRYITEWNGLRLPVDVNVKGDLVYVLEEGNDWDTSGGTKYGPSGVTIFSRDGKILSRWKNGERGTGGMYNIHGIAVDSDDNIYATQIYDGRSTVAYADCIFKFTRQR